MLWVVVQTIAGEREALRLTLEATNDTLALKRKIETSWHIPCECQVLIFDTVVLDDADIPACLSSKEHGVGTGGDLVLTLVVSSVGLRTRLEDPAVDERLRAVKMLTQMIHVGDDFATSALIVRMQDTNARVRLAAAEALPNAAEMGQERAITAAGTLFTDKNTHVRQAAMRSFCKLSPRGSLHALTIVRPYLMHFDDEVKLMAIQCLEHVAGIGEPFSIDLMIDCLNDVSERVKCAALRSLSTLAGESLAAIAAINTSLESAHASVRVAALDSLLKVSKHGDLRTIASVSARLEDTDAQVRRKAMESLSQLAKHDERHVVLAVGLRCDHRDVEVRHAALVTLTKVARRGDQRAVDGGRRCLKDEDPQVRRVAVNLLTYIANKNDQEVIADMTSRLSEDPDPVVRQSALMGLNQLATEITGGIVAAIGGCLEDEDAKVRQVAIQALACVVGDAGPGHDIAVAVASAYLPNANPDVRSTAVSALVVLGALVEVPVRRRAQGAARQFVWQSHVHPNVPCSVGEVAEVTEDGQWKVVPTGGLRQKPSRPAEQRLWKVVGGAQAGGIIVRDGQGTDSLQLSERLSSGSVVEEQEVVGDRLRFSKVAGMGPESGWVSLKLKNKDLLVPLIA